MSNDQDNQPSRPCSKCGQLLEPILVGTSMDRNFNTVKHYSYGHNCPTMRKAYDDRLEQINNSGMSDEQKRNATYAAGFMNAWAS